MNWEYLLIVPAVLALAAYVCLVFKLGFIVDDKTSQTGFGFGYYMMTVLTGFSLPVAILLAIYA